MARSKKGSWLTAHDLRSGLKEQQGSAGRVVELVWHRASGGFTVSVRNPKYNQHIITTDSLDEARQVFTAQCRKALRPSLEGGSR